MKTNRGKNQSRDAKFKATDGRLIESETGVYGPAAFLGQWFTKVVPKRFDVVKPKETDPIQKSEKPSQDVDQIVADMLSNNPTMNSSTFLNLLKSQGIKFTKEADSGSSMVALARGKESSISFRSVKFFERDNGPSSTDVGIAKPKDKYKGFTKFRSVMLQEGLGNFGDAYYYSAEALQSAAPVFEGKKIYADHPSSLDEQVRPERSVRDVLGHFENVHVEQLDDGRSQLIGDVVILPDDSFTWARSLMAHAVEFHEKFPDKEFIGLSINASGDAKPTQLAEFMKSELPQSVMTKLTEAVGKGIDEIKVVSAITEAVSCDLVTEAGAGGAIKNYLESNNLNLKGENMKTKNKENEGEAKPKVDPKAAKPEGEAIQKEGEAVDSAPHDDAAQDVELIKSMLKKAFGGEEDPSEQECAMAKEAIEAFGDMGHEKEKCHEMAMEFMKASKHMAAKQAEKAKESESESEEKPVEAAGEEPDADDEKPVKESAKLNAEVIKLRGELASYREQDKKRAVTSHVEKICKESKRSNAFTAEFKAVVKEARSVEEVNKAWKLFEAGSKHSSVSTDGAFEGITYSSEKLMTVADGERSDISFEDCTVY